MTQTTQVFGERFLRHPERILADEVSPWGEYCIDIKLPAKPVRLTGLNADQYHRLMERFSPRVIYSSNPIIVRILNAPSSWFHPWDRTRMGPFYDLDILRDATSIRIAGLGFIALITLSQHPSITIRTEAKSISFIGVVENVLRLFTAIQVLEHGGVMLHSAGIQLPGGAHLFWGHSGAGKSTFSRLAQTAGYPIISDDLNVILPSESGFQVEPVPFAGDLGQTSEIREPVPVRGLHQLHKSHDNRCVPLSAGRAMAGLFSCAPFVNTDPACTEPLLTRLEQLLAQIPTGMVYFSKTAFSTALFDELNHTGSPNG